MLNRGTEEHVVTRNIKRLRRFAQTLTANAETADSAVCAAVQNNSDSLISSEDFGRIFHALLREVYRNLYSQSDRRRKLSIVMPDPSKNVPLSVKFQSLDIDKRAVVSLHLIEELSTNDIASILDMPHDQVCVMTDQCLAYLSPCETEAGLAEHQKRAILN